MKPGGSLCEVTELDEATKENRKCLNREISTAHKNPFWRRLCVWILSENESTCGLLVIVVQFDLVCLDL